MTRILLISGGTHQGSLHSAALRTAADRVVVPGVTAAAYAGLRDLPAFVPGEAYPPAAVADLRERVNAADAVLFSAPEFAGSLPGSLKNLLDWLVDGGELQAKPVAWLSVLSQGQDESAIATLQTVLSHAGAKLLRAACVRVPVPPEAVDPDGYIGDERLLMALRDILVALGRSTVLAKPRPEPSWQAYSSVYPIVMRKNPAAFRGGGPARDVRQFPFGGS